MPLRINAIDFCYFKCLYTISTAASLYLHFAEVRAGPCFRFLTLNPYYYEKKPPPFCNGFYCYLYDHLHFV